ncbi:MAG: porin family protein [Cytophagaceae bacterium]
MKLSVIFTLLLFSTPLFAQKGFEFGIRFIPEKSMLINKNDLDAGSELDFKYPVNYYSGGIAVGYNFTSHFGLETNVLFSRQGQTYSGVMGSSTDPNVYSSLVALQANLAGDTVNGTYQARSELNCIKVPVMAKISTDNAKRLFFNVLAGPQLNMIKGVAQELNKEDQEYTGLDVDPQDLYKKVTIDGVLAFGLGLNLSSHFVLSTQARFDYGFQDVEKKNKTYDYQGSTHRFWSADRKATHNATAGLSIGVSYKL